MKWILHITCINIKFTVHSKMCQVHPKKFMEMS